MKIRSIKLFPVRGPMSDLCFAKVETEDGVLGWEKDPFPAGGVGSGSYT